MAFQFNSNSNAGSASSGFTLNSMTPGSTFGGSQNQQGSGGLFGKPAAAGSPAVGASSTGFSFGQQQQQPQQSGTGSTSGFSFGQNQPQFGQNQTQPQNSTQGSTTGFGAGNTSSSGGGLFGQTSNQPASGGLFGQNANASGSTGGGLFGQANNTTNAGSSSGGLFNKPAGGLFGGSTAPTPGFGLGLNQNQNQTQNQTTGSSLFGSKPASTPSGGLFGQQTSSQPTTGGLFGGQTQQTSTTGGGLFSKPQQSTTGGLFGSSQTPAVTSGLFGQGTNPAQQQQQQQQQQVTVVAPQNMPAPLSAYKPKKAATTPNSLRAKHTSRLGLGVSRQSPYDRNSVAHKGSQGIKDSQFHGDVSLLSEGFLSADNRLMKSRSNERSLFAPSSRSYLDDFSHQNSVKPIDNVKRLVIRRDGAASKLQEVLGSAPSSSQQINGVASNSHETPHNTLQQSRSRNLTNPIAVQEGYWCEPTLEELYQMPKSKLSSVPNFRVGRRGFGQIEFLQPVDLLSIPELSDILGIYVAFSDRQAVVYPEFDENAHNPLRRKPPMGQGLNQPAIITLENLFPREKANGRIITDRDSALVRKYEACLRNSKDREHISYVLETGVWVFKVPHFTVYAAPEFDEGFDEYMIADSDDELDEELVPVNPQQIQAIAYEPDQDLDDLHDRYSIDEAPNGEQEEDDRQLESEPVSFDDYAPANRVENGFQEGQLVHLAEQNQEPPYLIKRALSTSSAGSFEQLVPQPATWLGQLKQSSMRIGGLLDKQDRPSRKRLLVDSAKSSSSMTGLELGELIHGESDSPVTSLARQYREAAEKLRLPPLRNSRLRPRFSPGSGSLVTNSSLGGLKIVKIAGTGTHDKLPFKRYAITWSERENGLFHAEPQSSLSFSQLAETWPSNDKASRDLWLLASLLFDPIPNLGGDMSEDKYRRNKLSEWLEAHVSTSVQQDLDMQHLTVSSLDSVPLLLSGHNISTACRAALESGNPHLAVTMTLMGSIDDSVREIARDQLKDWREQNTIYKIPVQIRHVYELLSGNTTKSGSRKFNGQQVPSLYLSEGLDWKRAFGLKLWYGIETHESVAKAVDLYINDIDNTLDTKVQAPDHGDILFLLMKLCRSSSRPNPDVGSLLESASTSSCEAWYLYLLLVVTSNRFNYDNGDQLAVHFGSELESQGSWKEAIFVYSHISDDELSLKLIRRALFRNIASVPFGEEDEVVNELHLPLSLIYEARAQLAHYEQQYEEEAKYLINAELYDEAHSVVVTNVAPQSVVSKNLDVLESLLLQLETKPIADWVTGGLIYLDYIKLLKHTVPAAEVLQVADRLCTGLSRVRVRQNVQTKVAISLIAQFVRRYNLDGGKILQMKMNEQEIRHQTVHLAGEYLRKKVNCI